MLLFLLFQGQDHGKNQACEDNVQGGDKAASNVDIFVTTRRGKEKAIKRKLNDPAADRDVKMTPKVLEDN